MILEEENVYWQLQLSVVQAARSPSSKKEAKAIEHYVRDLRKGIENSLTPWHAIERARKIKERIESPVHSHVIVDGPGPDVDGLRELAKSGELQMTEKKNA